MRVVVHNVWVGQKPRPLRRNLSRLANTTTDPWRRRPPIMVQEGKRLRKPPRGYTDVAYPDPRHPDDEGMRLLVPDHLEVIRPRFVKVDGPWWRGPHGDKHPPKIFVGATVEDTDGQRWDLLSVHRTWTGRGKRNMDSWAAEHVALVEWMRSRATRDGGTRPVVAGGDWNGGAGDRYPRSIADLATAVGGMAALEGIDGVVTVNTRRPNVSELASRFGSDGHRPVVADVTRRPNP